MRSFLLILIYAISLPILSFSQELNQIDDRNMKQGKWRKAYLSGVVKYEGQFKNDQPYGEFNYYYENGELQAKTIFSADGIIAYTKIYHQNGQPMADGKYIRQLRDSTWNFYSDIDGKIIASEQYKMGKYEGENILYYAESGKQAEVTAYKNDLKDGIFVKYFPDGKIMTKGTYKQDQLDGDFTVFYPDGSIEIKGHYLKGIKEGNWEYYNEAGEPLTEEQYKEESQ